MPRSLKAQAATIKKPAKVGSIYTSALLFVMPPGVPRYLAQKHSDHVREAFETALAWSLPYIKESGVEPPTLDDAKKLANRMDEAVQALCKVEAEIAAIAEKKRGKK